MIESCRCYHLICRLAHQAVFLDDEEKTRAVELERGKLEAVERILRLLGDGPMRPSEIREAIGISNCTHFNRYYLAPMLSRGLIERTDPEHSRSPQQKYRLA